MVSHIPLPTWNAFSKAVLTARLFLFGLLLLSVAGKTLFAQTPVITVRFSNPQYDCATEEYCLDVDFKSDTDSQAVFGMNVRFFYDDDILELIDFRDFEDGYGPFAPNPPLISTSGPAGPAFFNFAGPAEFVNGAMQLSNVNADPIYISTTSWTRLFSVCFSVDDPGNLDVFCPSVVWDLEQDPANGGFLTGDNGVVVTLRDPDNNANSLAAVENVEQFNWEYIGMGAPPYGQPDPTECISLRCIDLSLDKSIDNPTPSVGSTIVFSIDIDNAGPDSAHNVVVTDLLPSGFTYVSDNSGGDYDDGTGEWDIDSLAAGGSDTLEITATVNASGDYTNLAEVTSAGGQDIDSTPNNGVDTDNDNDVENDPDDEDDGDGVVLNLSSASIALIKEGTYVDNPPTGASPGDEITYAFTVTNTGSVSLTNIIVTDPLPGIVLSGNPIASLAVGVSDNSTITGIYTITQADIDAGGVTNQATATGTPPAGPDVTDDSDDDSNLENDPTEVPLLQEPSIALIKAGTFVDNPPAGASVGDEITYAFTVTNTGNVTLTNVNVTDPLPGIVLSGNPIASMAPGDIDNTTITGIYTITQADIDAGDVTNQALVTGTPPIGPDVTDDSDDDSNLEDDPTEVPLVQDPSIALIKEGTYVDNPPTGASPGDEITYAFTVTNTGNVTLTNVTVTDPLPGIVLSGNPIASMAPGDVDNTTITGIYTITQADIDAGGVANQALVTGTPPTGPDVTDDSDDNSNLEDDPTDVPLVQNPSIALIKEGTYVDNPPTGASPGDEITYAFTVTNTGNVTLTNVTVTDPLPGIVLSGNPIASMAPGDVDNTTITGIYTITQADIDAGGVANQATVTGTPPIGLDVTDDSDDDSNLEDDPTDIPLVQDPSIALIKEGIYVDNPPTGASPGDEITYAFTVTNTGNVTLTNVTVTDPLPGIVLSGNPIASMAPGDVDNTTITGIYTITQADIDAGGVTNQATVTGTPPIGLDVTDDSDDDSNLEDDPTEVPLVQDPSIALIKAGTYVDNLPTGISVGDEITYAFTVTNTGNVSLTNVTVTDPLPGIVLSGGPIASMAPGDVDNSTITGIYTITQADIDAGQVSNQALATSTPPIGPDVTDDSDDDSNLEDDPTVILLTLDPSIALIKEGSYIDNPPAGASVGDEITYVFSVTNTGNVALTNVTVTDPLPGIVLSGNPIALLGAGDTDNTTITGIYTVTQADIDAAGVTNQALATGTPPSGPDVTDDSDDDSNLEDDPTIIPLIQGPALALIKEGTYVDNPPTGASVGDEIIYAFTITNVGNTVVTNVNVTDVLPGIVLSGGPIVSMAPGDVDNTTITGIYTITQADIDAGGVTNQALATGTPPIGPDVTDDSDDDSILEDDPTEVPLVQDPSIALIKAGTYVDNPPVGVNPGDEISYAFTVTNTGNVTLTNVVVTDPLPGIVLSGGPIASMAPGDVDNTTVTGIYTITQADIDAGGVTNQALATGTPPTGPDVTDDSDDDSNLEDDLTYIPVLQVLNIALVKVGTYVDNPPAGVNPGDEITYAFTVKNTGNVTLTNVIITDPLPGIVLSGGPIATLGVGDSDNATFTGIYTITQADILAGGVENQATATGTPPMGQDITDLSDDESELEDDPTFTLLPCASIEAWVYLEGAVVLPDGTQNYAIPMRSTLNDLRLLPGQIYEDPFLGTYYTLPGQPYNIAPWNYAGNEGDLFDSGGDTNFADADYPATVVDWVLVSLRTDSVGTGGAICQAAALLHKDGAIEFVDDFTCCDIELDSAYYLVVEHRNHLIVMSHERVNIVSGKITYDFRAQQSYVFDPYMFGVFAGQKEFLTDKFCMYGGNGNQTLSAKADTDINFDDRTYWESGNGIVARYRNADYNLNGDTNFNDRRIWEVNNGRFTSVPRD